MLDGVKLILENNSFCFNDIFFIQSKGKAMGTNVAPVYVTLVLAYLEENMYEHSEEEFDSHHYENTPIQIYWIFYNQKRKIFR